jgi:hypothetical protein
VYTKYLFGQGAFAKGAAPLDGTPLQGDFGTEGVEIGRVPLDSDTVLINRHRYILHPLGVKFTSASVAGDSPTNAELETAANWVRVSDQISRTQFAWNQPRYRFNHAASGSAGSTSSDATTRCAPWCSAVPKAAAPYAYRDIAPILGVPVGTVKSRIARGIAHLREIVLADSSHSSTPLPADAPNGALVPVPGWNQAARFDSHLSPSHV